MIQQQRINIASSHVSWIGFDRMAAQTASGVPA
jgi:hypothetical protein